MRGRLFMIIWACLLAGGTTAAASGSLLIQTSARFQRLGDYRISANPTYAGASAALGSSTSCRLVGRDPSWAVATWRSLGVRMKLRTYGVIPRGKTGCTAPRAIQVSTIRVTGQQWHTSLGLRVGDRVAKLRRGYENASATAGVSGWYGGGYWLVTRRTVCARICDGRRFVTAPVLVAEIHGGRVAALVFVVGAEGE